MDRHRPDGAGPHVRGRHRYPAGHEAVAGILKPGDFAVDPVDGSRLEGTIDAGFVFVDNDRVTIVADNVELPGAAAA